MSEHHQNQQVPEPELLGRWHHGQGFLCCGSLRIARADFDTNPTFEFQEQVFEDICNTMNDRLAAYRADTSKAIANEAIRETAYSHAAPAQPQEPVAITLMTDDRALAWAWEKVKSDFGAEQWTAIEHQKCHALFLFGWNYRAQLQRQRPSRPQPAQQRSDNCEGEIGIRGTEAVNSISKEISGSTQMPPSSPPEKVPGMAFQALAGEIIEALLADEKDDGFDLTAGLFGKNFSVLVRRWAAAEWHATQPDKAIASCIKSDQSAGLPAREKA